MKKTPEAKVRKPKKKGRQVAIGEERGIKTAIDLGTARMTVEGEMGEEEETEVGMKEETELGMVEGTEVETEEETKAGTNPLAIGVVLKATATGIVHAKAISAMIRALPVLVVEEEIGEEETMVCSALLLPLHLQETSWRSEEAAAVSLPIKIGTTPRLGRE